MTDNIQNTPEQSITEQQIAEYLREHPEFFIKHEYLLKELTLPHDSGKAISLGERQVQVFREHRDELKAQLNELISAARLNDQIFEKSKRLLLNLLEVNSLDEVDLVVQTAFHDDQKIDFANVMVFGKAEDYPLSKLRVIPLETAKNQLGTLVDSQNAVCGRFSAKQLECLFPSTANEVGSAAVIPLRNGDLLGIFALGSRDATHFEASMGSLFLSYISDFLARILPGLLLRSKAKKTIDKIPSLLD